MKICISLTFVGVLRKFKRLEETIIRDSLVSQPFASIVVLVRSICGELAVAFAFGGRATRYRRMWSFIRKYLIDSVSAICSV